MVEQPRFACIVAAAIVAMAPAVRAASPVDFNRDVRAILSDKCFACHGPDEGRRKAKLRLDTPEGARAAAESGEPAVVPGDLEASELVARITSDDPEVRMPPAKGGKPLNEGEVATLKAWVEQGASYDRHWAFEPPARPATPAVRDPSWVKNPVDTFVLARLEREGLHPSPEAGKATLIRRLSLDLIGLPPTIAEVDAYLADAGSDAYEKVVDRLLASPRYGERQARAWLDAARYADSDGYEKDKIRRVHFYRDWVIDALNRDLPFDRFVIEQIAGDLLPGGSQSQRVATGFLRNSMVNEEGGVDPEQFRMEAMFDRMDAIGKGVLGLTIQCAQCHTHKYDPITHEEYYQLFAFLNDTHEPNVAVYTPDEQARRVEVFRAIAAIEDDLRHRHPDWPARMADWESKAAAGRPDWTVIRPEVDDISTGGQRYKPMHDGSLIACGYAPTKHQVKLTAKVEAGPIAAFRLELLNDPNLPLGGPGRSPEGTGALTEFLVDVAPADAPAKVTRVKFVRASADVAAPETPLKPMYDDKSGKARVTGPIAFAIDGKDETAWGIDVGPGRRNQPRQAVFIPETPIDHPSGTIVTVHLKQNHGGWNSDDNQTHNLGRIRLAIFHSADAEADSLTPAARAALAVPAESRTPAQVAALFESFRASVPEWKDANDRIEQLWAGHPEGTTQLVLGARPTDDRRETRMLDRGDFLKPTKSVKAGVPAFLNPLPEGQTPDRLTFARWLVDRKAPTTARAAVNRAWQGHFGVGLVASSEDFGLQGDPPSHRDLLDWLAVEFMDGGWSPKALHRTIVTSATYRQSSRVEPELLARDPANRLLARGSRFRADAEVVRDVALAAAGLLDPTVGGPSVFPPAPAFLFVAPASYGPKIWTEATGPGRHRRALYTFRYRSVPYPALQAFDAPNGDASCVRRSRSNTPIQALTTLNEPIFLEAARALALRTVREGGDADTTRLEYAFRRCLARRPTAAEATALLALLDRQGDRFEPGGLDPWQLAADDPKSPPTLPEGVSPARLAAWTAVSRVLLNLDETITQE